MNLPELEKKLLQTARNHPPADTVPYAFEKRIMALVTALPAVDPLAFWGHILWRAAAPCVAIMLLLSAWTYLASAPGNSFADDLETTVLAGWVQLGESW